MQRNAEEIIQNYISELESLEIPYYDKERFAQKSFSLSAAEQLLEEIRDIPFTSALYLTENFVKKMDRLSCMNPKTSFMFSVSHDVGLEILDRLITY